MSGNVARSVLRNADRERRRRAELVSAVVSLVSFLLIPASIFLSYDRGYKRGVFDTAVKMQNNIKAAAARIAGPEQNEEYRQISYDLLNNAVFGDGIE